MENRRSENFWIKFIVVLGAFAAIATAAALLYVRYKKRPAKNEFEFDMDDFIDDCEDCAGSYDGSFFAVEDEEEPFEIDAEDEGDMPEDALEF